MVKNKTGALQILRFRSRDFFFDIMKYRIMIGSYGAFIICGVAKRGVFLSALSAVSSLVFGTFRSQSNPQHLRVLASLSFSQSRPHRDFSRGAVRGDFGGIRWTPDFGMLLRVRL